MSLKLDAIQGNSQRLDGGAMFGNAPKAMWEKLSPPDASNRILLRCRSLLVREAGRCVLFETGIGSFFEPRLRERYGVAEPGHLLLEGLAQLGVADSDIDCVVLSHLHFDHAGGLLSPWEDGKEPSLLFPKARYVVSEPHWHRARAPHPRDRASFVPALCSLLEASGRLDLVSPAQAQEAARRVAPWLSFRFSEGHTVGLMLSSINCAGKHLIYASDLVPGAPWVSASLSMGYDRYAELVLDEKKALLDECSTQGHALFFTHDADFDCGVVSRDDATGKYRCSGLSLPDWLRGVAP